MSAAKRLGREGAIEALLDAAEDLFVAHGPAAVSLRDVARRAGVNHGLIHHYIGSRDDLLHAVFSRATERARATVDGSSDVGEALDRLRALGGSDDGFTRLLAWALLEGHDPRAIHGRSAALDAIAGASGRDDRMLRMVLAAAMVQTLGWKLFGEYARVAAGLDDEDPESLRREIDAVIDRAVRDAALDRGER